MKLGIRRSPRLQPRQSSADLLCRDQEARTRDEPEGERESALLLLLLGGTVHQPVLFVRTGLAEHGIRVASLQRAGHTSNRELGRPRQIDGRNNLTVNFLVLMAADVAPGTHPSRLNVAQLEATQELHQLASSVHDEPAAQLTFEVQKFFGRFGRHHR